MKKIWCRFFGHSWITFKNPDAEGYKTKSWADGKECRRCGLKEKYDY